MRCPHCNKPILNGAAIAIEHNGEKLSLRDLARATGIPYTTLQNRYDGGVRGKDLITLGRARRPENRPKDPPSDVSKLMRQFISAKTSNVS